jgi:hypothetical protein
MPQKQSRHLISLVVSAASLILLKGLFIDIQAKDTFSSFFAENKPEYETPVQTEIRIGRLFKVKYFHVDSV